MLFDVKFEYEDTRLEINIEQSKYTKLYVLKVKACDREIYNIGCVLVEDAIRIAMDFMKHIFE